MTPHAYHKHDSEGRPLYFERSGAVAVDKVLHIIDADALMARHLWQMIFLERKCVEATAALGRPVTKATYVFDLNNLRYAGCYGHPSRSSSAPPQELLVDFQFALPHVSHHHNSDSRNTAVLLSD